MFTGIVETFGEIVKREKEGENLRLTLRCPVTGELKIDQSVAHNGVCLTVVSIADDLYEVIAVKETLDVTTIGSWEVGERINLERAMTIGDRLDGHIVQGHVDGTAVLDKIIPQEGSREFYFTLSEKCAYTLVDKGSVCIDGVSLTVVKSIGRKFHVAIIPYTYEHTVFHQYQIGMNVNIEFDIIGKYIQRYMKQINISQNE